MEQIKPYLVMLKKQHFWVLSGIVLLAAVACWFMAASTLRAEYEANLGTIKSKEDAVKAVANKQDHPNERWQTGLDKDNATQKTDVLAAWEKRYQEQLKVPQWPVSAFGQEFVDHIETVGPKGEIDGQFRELYSNFILDDKPTGAMESLFSIVNYRKLDWIRDKDGKPLVQQGPGGAGGMAGGLGEGGLGGAAGGAGGAAGPGTEWKGIVAWPEASRLLFRERYNWPRTPTTLQVRYANEDLWVMTALLDIIARTNVDVKEHMLAKVKGIDAINIGQMVPPPEQFLVFGVPGAGLGGEGMGEGGVPPVGDASGGMEAGIPGGEGGAVGADGAAAPGLAGPALIDATIKHLRYVDSKGKPVGHDQPDPFAEFKIMPFQMLLVMDQRRVPDLLVNCANSPLPIEVRQVKVTARNFEPVDVAEAQGGGGGMGGGLGGGMDGGGGLGGGMPGGGLGGGLGGMGGRGGLPGGEGGMGGLGGMGGGGLGGMSGGGLGGMGGGQPGQEGLGGEIELNNSDLSVEIRGVVYIFNFPDKTKLNTGAEALNAAPADPTLPATAPAPGPPGQIPAAGQAPAAGGQVPAAGGQSPPTAVPPADPNAGATAPPAVPPAAVPPATPPPGTQP